MVKRSRILRAFSIAALVLGISSQAARGQDGTTEAKRKASHLVDEGVALFESGDYERALARFQEAYAAFPSAKIFLNIGEALKRLDRNAEAAQAYDRFLFETAQRADVSEAKRRLAQSALSQLSRRVGRLRVEASPEAATITVDGNNVETAPGRPIYVEPGTHALAASAPGHLVRTVNLEIGRGEEKSFQLSLDQVPTAAPLMPLPIATPTPPPPPKAPPERHEERSHVWTWVAAGTAVALLAGGLVFGEMASSSYDDYKMTRSPTRYDQLRDDVDSQSTIANTLLISAGAAAVAAGVLYFVEGRPAAWALK
jgi:tetratricopeptide (TPR) repeat protein